MRALIVEHGSNRGSLAAARGLRAAGWRVDLATSRGSYTRRSRTVGQTFPLPSPDDDADAFVEATRRAIAAGGAEVVFPVDDSQLLLLSSQRERLGAVLPYPAHEVVARTLDRLELAQLARDIGLGAPRTWEANGSGLDDARGPVVVKARRPALIGGPEEESARVETWIGSAPDAREWIADLNDEGVDVVVQQLMLGRLASVTVLTDDDGAVVAESHQVTQRIWPTDAGVSTRATTVAPDAHLSGRIHDLLDELGWTGFAQLQFIVDEGGHARLIDFNPRFYGSLSLAIGAGVNYPAMWAALATGRPRPVPAMPRTGVRYHWLGGDLRRAVRERRGGLTRDLVRTLDFSASAVHPIWSARDPLPFAHCLAKFARDRF